MNTIRNPAIGRLVANGIRTNYLEDGSGDDTWCSSTARARASRRTRTGGW